MLGTNLEHAFEIISRNILILPFLFLCEREQRFFSRDICNNFYEPLIILSGKIVKNPVFLPYTLRFFETRFTIKGQALVNNY